MDVATVVKPAAAVLALALFAAGGGPAAAQAERAGGAAGPPLPVVSPAAGLEALSFMSGCWEGTFESGDLRGTIEEHYTSPSENLILGTTRWLVEGSAIQFEFSELWGDSTGVWLRPYPGGEASPHAFRLTRAEKGEAVFEAPEHDFPKRVLYRREAGGSLSARIDGGEGSADSSEWRMRPADCPG